MIDAVEVVGEIGHCVHDRFSCPPTGLFPLNLAPFGVGCPGTGQFPEAALAREAHDLPDCRKWIAPKGDGAERDWRGSKPAAKRLPTGKQSAPIAQLDRALPSEGRGQRFESSWVRHGFARFCRAARARRQG